MIETLTLTGIAGLLIYAITKAVRPPFDNDLVLVADIGDRRRAIDVAFELIRRNATSEYSIRIRLYLVAGHGPTVSVTRADQVSRLALNRWLTDHNVEHVTRTALRLAVRK